MNIGLLILGIRASNQLKEKFQIMRKINSVWLMSSKIGPDHNTIRFNRNYV